MYIIVANIFGKKRYWNFIDGFHSGRSKRKGYSTYKSVEEANVEVAKLKTVFHSGISYIVVSSNEIPFIKSQLKK